MICILSWPRLSFLGISIRANKYKDVPLSSLYSVHFPFHNFQEPVNNEEDIIRFCDETGMPAALDESINYIRENPLYFLQKYIHPGVAAVVSTYIY